MRKVSRGSTALVAVLMVLGAVGRASAQDPPPRIGPFVVDVRGSLPRMPGSEALAASRGLTVDQLPGRAMAFEGGVHVYPLTLRSVTLGIGGRVALMRARATPGGTLSAVTARQTSVAPQLSLNFGNGNGWSYLSVGVGQSRWSIVADGAGSQEADEAWVRGYDVGGGARWFVRRHLAFHIDVRLHAMGAGRPQTVLPAAPATRFLVMGAGLSVK